MNDIALPPSSAARRVACPGSRALEQKYDNHQNVDLDGHAAHWVAAQMLMGLYENESIDPNRQIITHEMIEGGRMYADYILPIVRATKGVFNVEHRIDIPSIHPLCRGTVDAWFYSNNHLHVFEYKFGHAFVDVFENYQMLEYAIGILDYLQDENCLSVTFHLIQPRCFHRDGHIRTWTIDRATLSRYRTFLRDKESQSLDPNAPCVPNPECKTCLGRFACEALQRSALQSIELMTVNTPHELTPEQVGNELRLLMHAAKMLDARITGLTEQALHHIKSGRYVAHFIMEPVIGRRKWSQDTDAVLLLGQMFDIDLSVPMEAVTPAQAVKAGIPEDIVNQYSTRPIGAMKLVEAKANKVFKK